jgi:hypothetical protein
LSSTGSVTQSQKVAALGLELLGTNGIYTLTNTGNAITTMAANTGAIEFVENSGFTVGVVNTTGITTNGNVILSSTGGVTFAANITSGSGTQTYIAPITLSTGAIVLTSTNKDVWFYGSTSTINGAQSLTVNAGSGIVTFDGIIGASAKPSALSVSSSTGIILGANISTIGVQTYDGPVTLANNASLTSVGESSNTRYDYSGSVQSITVSGNSVTLTLVGGGGGVGVNDGCCIGMNGGLSGSFTATVAVTPGTILQLAPGLGGAAGVSAT